MQLAKEFNSTSRSTRSFSIFQKLPTFNFEYSKSPLTSPGSISPILTETETETLTINKQNNLNNDDNLPIFSNQTTPTSPVHASSTSPVRISYSPSTSSTTQVSITKKSIGLRHSAFKPYINQTNSYLTSVLSTHDKSTLIPFHMKPLPDATLIQPETQAAQMEIIVSNLGKSKQGHLCIYCGKIYSRKYGLKIHIRY
jgi:hypothetical protein